MASARMGLGGIRYSSDTLVRVIKYGGIPCIGFLIPGEAHITATESGCPSDAILEGRSLTCRHLSSSKLLPHLLDIP